MEAVQYVGMTVKTRIIDILMIKIGEYYCEKILAIINCNYNW
jgi:hypothetical protein